MREGYYAWNVQSRFLLVLTLAACGDDTPAGQDATTIDASPACACTFGAATAAGTIASAEARELSGLATSRVHANTVWTHNDSGDSPRLFAIGTGGSARGVLSITGAAATDWEDMAIGPCGAGAWCLYAADIGDNDLVRASVRIHEIDEPAQIDAAMSATSRTFDVAYPDGPHNSEALIIDPRDGDAYVITKQTPPAGASPSKVFRMPKGAGVAMAVEVGTLAIPTGNLLVTGADFYADGCGVRLLVRTYSHVFELSGAPDSTIEDLLHATMTPVPAATEAQGEAVAWEPHGRGYLTVSEGDNPTLSRVTCL